MKQFNATDLLEKGKDRGYPSESPVAYQREKSTLNPGLDAPRSHPRRLLSTSLSVITRESARQQIPRGYLECATERIPLGIFSDERTSEEYFCALFCICRPQDPLYLSQKPE